MTDSYDRFRPGDSVQVLHQGKLLRGRWRFVRAYDSEREGLLLVVRRIDRASPRTFSVRDTELFDLVGKVPEYRSRRASRRRPGSASTRRAS